MELGYAPLTILLCIVAKQKAKREDDKQKTKLRSVWCML